MRAALRRLRARAAHWSGADRRARAKLDGSRAAVLMYHRVLPREQAERRGVEPGMYVTPRTFERHLEWLTSFFHVVPLHELVACVEARRPFTRGAVAVSFDDGWRDNHEHAFEPLRRRGLPATVFLVASRVGSDGDFWPDEVSRRLAGLAPRERRAVAARLGLPGVRGSGGGRDATARILAALKALPTAVRSDRLALLRELAPEPWAPARELLDWREVERMASAGVGFESHALTHALLASAPPEEARRELSESLRLLRERGHARHALLAWPAGAHDAASERLARELGYRAAFTTRPGLLGTDSDAMRLPRIGLHEDVASTREEFLRLVPGAGLG